MYTTDNLDYTIQTTLANMKNKQNQSNYKNLCFVDLNHNKVCN